MSKRLIIDCQLLQSRALHRGMGKYTVALLNEMQAKTPYDRVEIILNKELESKEDQELINNSLAGYKVVRLGLKKANHANPSAYDKIRSYNQGIIDEYITKTAEKTERVDFMITSLFQENECPVFPSGAIHKYMLIYDLIPLQFPDYYLKEGHSKYLYLSRFKVLFEATRYFTISTTVANDLSLHLGIPHDKITPIHGSYISRKHLSPKRPRSIGANEKFILMPTGDDVRKNNVRATAAFNEFNAKTGYAYKLVITSFFSEKTKNELLLNSNHVVFTDNIPEDGLAWLYKNAEAVLFVSEYEGLGMPPLEAIEFNKPVICSDIDVFKEISQTAFNFCDPYDVSDISATLQKVMLERDTAINKTEYQRVLTEFTWGRTAQKTCSGFEAALRDDKQNTEESLVKPKVAVFCPAPNGYSAIGKVVQEQHYELSQIADVDYYLENGISEKAKQCDIRVNYLPYVADVRTPWAFNKRHVKKYDEIIFHIGNSEYHVATVMKSLAINGTVILHDTKLKELFDLLDDLGYMQKGRITAEKQLEAKIASEKDIKGALDSSCIVSITNNAKKTITHSKFAADAVSQVDISGSEVVCVGLPTPSPFEIYNHKDKDVFTVGYAGILHSAKGLDEITNLTKNNYPKPVQIKLFGFSLLAPELEERLSLDTSVSIVQKPSDTRFIHELEMCDVVVGFRPDYHGETSLSALESLRLGKRVIVNNTGWFQELPHEVVTKISSLTLLSDTIKRLINEPDGDEETHARLGYIRKKHNTRDYVRSLIA